MKEIVRLFLDGSVSLGQETFTLSTPGEKLRLVVIYLCQGSISLKLDFSVKHLAPDTHSELYVYGIMKDTSKKSCYLHLDFCRGCHGASGIEKEEVLLLSENADNFSQPTINCSEQDVHGSHGVSVGQIDDVKLEYLMSRGLTQASATQILTKAQIYKALSKISDQKLRNSTQKLLDRVEW